MERRKFLGLMIGGVATAAAVRTFPFRVFSFPTNISLIEPVSGYRDPVEVAIWRGVHGAQMMMIEQISLAEAKVRYGYEWRAGNPKTQQSVYDANVYGVPLYIGSTTGLI